MPSIWEELEEVAEAYQHEQTGTITPAVHFNSKKDAEDLRKAMKGAGSDEDKLISILTNRSSHQRQQISKSFEELTGDSLVKELKSETGNNLEDALVALMMTPAEYDANELQKAMKGVGTKDKVLIEIFASRNNHQIKVLNNAFKKENDELLVRSLRSELAGDFQDAVVKLNEGNRDEDTEVHKQRAERDAKALYDASEKKWGTEEKTFIDILCMRSIHQLQYTLKVYKELCGKSLQETIESEMKGNMEDLMDAIVKCVKSVPAYFAEILHDCLKGSGTDEKTLCRVMVSRSEIDLMDIRRKYKKMYNRSLYSAIEKDLKGDFRRCMMSICGGDD